MAATLEHYTGLADDLPDTESLTVLVAAGATRDEVAAALQVDLATEVEDAWEVEGATGWAIVEVPGGVLAMEQTGYGDPTLAALEELSAGGRAAAVVRSNIQAHDRFGCARDGVVLFDDDEFTSIEDPGVVPADLRALFELAWQDLDDDGDGDEEEDADPFLVGLAMAEVVTGLELTAAHLETLTAAGFFMGPTLVYPDPVRG